MFRIKYVDCRRTSALTLLRNDYVALQEADKNNEELTLATLDKGGWGLTFSDKYFRRFVNGSGDEAIEEGRLKYVIALRVARNAAKERKEGKGLTKKIS